MKRPPAEFLRGVHFAQEYAEQLSEEAAGEFLDTVHEMASSVEQPTQKEISEGNYELGKLQGRQEALTEFSQKITEAAYKHFN